MLALAPTLMLAATPTVPATIALLLLVVWMADEGERQEVEVPREECCLDVLLTLTDG